MTPFRLAPVSVYPPLLIAPVSLRPPFLLAGAPLNGLEINGQM